jgi:hypothetical protein
MEQVSVGPRLEPISNLCPGEQNHDLDEQVGSEAVSPAICGSAVEVVAFRVQNQTASRTPSVALAVTLRIPTQCFGKCGQR